VRAFTREAARKRHFVAARGAALLNTTQDARPYWLMEAIIRGSSQPIAINSLLCGVPPTRLAR
jgi:hypothetical protein